MFDDSLYNDSVTSTAKHLIKLFRAFFVQHSNEFVSGFNSFVTKSVNLLHLLFFAAVAVWCHFKTEIKKQFWAGFFPPSDFAEG